MYEKEKVAGQKYNIWLGYFKVLRLGEFESRAYHIYFICSNWLSNDCFIHPIEIEFVFFLSQMNLRLYTYDDT